MAVEDVRSKTPTLVSLGSKRDLYSLSEVTDYATGGFLRSTFTYIDGQDVAWIGQMPKIRKYDLTIEDIHQALQRLPDETVYPLHSWTSVASNVDRTKSFIKRPKTQCADDKYEAQALPRILLEEAEVLEILRRHPHPNNVGYHGCIVNRGYIVGLAFDKYDIILQYRHEDVPHDLDIRHCMNGLRAGVRHLHSLGLAHNDLNPANVALDCHDNPVILDFGSCKRFGEELLSGGTHGWVDDDYSFSDSRHDEIALDKIETWLTEREGSMARCAQ